jgi:hypothetical protein
LVKAIVEAVEIVNGKVESKEGAMAALGKPKVRGQ